MTHGNNLYEQLKKLYENMLLLQEEKEEGENLQKEKTKFLRLILTTKFLETYLSNIVYSADTHQIIASLHDDPNINDYLKIKSIAQECCELLDKSRRDSVEIMTSDVVTSLEKMAIRSWDAYKVKETYAKEVLENFSVDFTDIARFLKEA